MPNKKRISNSQKEDAPKRSLRNKNSKIVEESSDSEEFEEEKSVEENFENKIEKTMRKVMNDFKKEIKMDLREFERSLSFTTDKMDEVLVEIKKLKERQVDLENENKMLREKMMKMENSVEELEQYSRNRNIQIDGIPCVKDENLEKLVQDIATQIDVEITGGEIDVVHRIPSRYNKNPEPIVVQFLSRKKRDEMIEKGKKKKINTTNLNISGPQKPVFINEHLTVQRKRLLYEAKIKKNEMNFKYVWSKGGKVFMRKTDTSNVIQLNSLEQLNKLQ